MLKASVRDLHPFAGSLLIVSCSLERLVHQSEGTQGIRHVARCWGLQGHPPEFDHCCDVNSGSLNLTILESVAQAYYDSIHVINTCGTFYYYGSKTSCSTTPIHIRERLIALPIFPLCIIKPKA